MIGNRFDLIGNVRSVHLFLLMNGFLLLELVLLVQHPPDFQHPAGIFAPPIVVAFLTNIAFLAILEEKCRWSRGAREALFFGESEKISEKIVILNLWIQVGVLRFGVLLVTILANTLSVVFLYQIVFP